MHGLTADLSVWRHRVCVVVCVPACIHGLFAINSGHCDRPSTSPHPSLLPAVKTAGVFNRKCAFTSFAPLLSSYVIFLATLRNYLTRRNRSSEGPSIRVGHLDSKRSIGTLCGPFVYPYGPLGPSVTCMYEHVWLFMVNKCICYAWV